VININTRTKRKIISKIQENTMSKKFEYKSKLFRKIHQLQKRLTRTKQNPGHSQDKVSFRERLIKKYINRIREK
jgi:hypothetical protein